jgi:hypothetical protein
MSDVCHGRAQAQAYISAYLAYPNGQGMFSAMKN